MNRIKEWFTRRKTEVEFPLVDLSTQKGYNVAAAIRGPDNHQLWALKSIFTVRIRHSISIGGYQIIYRVDPNVLHDTIVSLEKSPIGANHYLRHIQDATLALGTNNLYDAATMMINTLYGEDTDEELLLKLLNEGIEDG